MTALEKMACMLHALHASCSVFQALKPFMLHAFNMHVDMHVHRSFSHESFR